MTKKEIVKQISERANLTQLKTKEIVQMTFDAIIDTLVAEKRIELRNFGVFEVKLRKPRRARNPRTNQTVEVEAKYVVTFQPGKIMEERVRNLTAPANSARLATIEDEDDLDDGEELDTIRLPVPVGAAIENHHMDGLGRRKDSDSHDDLMDGVLSSDIPLKPR